MKRKLALLTVAVFISIFVLTAAGGILHAEAQPAVAHVCGFYSADGQLIKNVQVADGGKLAPVNAPVIEGKRFSHWYQVNASLQGSPGSAFSFSSPVTEPVYLKAHYEQLPEATSAPAPEATEAPATQPPKTEAPVTQPPKTEAPVTQPPKTEAPVTQPPETEAPVTQPSRTEAPVAEKPAAEPAEEDPAVEKPAAEEPTVEEPSSDEPAAEQPQEQEPAGEEPAAEEPTVEEPSSDEPAAEQPQEQEPAGEEPAAEEPSSDEPAAEQPAEQEPPAGEEPASEEPSSDEPAAEQPQEQEETDTLLSETEVNTYLVRFYDSQGQEWRNSPVLKGQPVSEPETVPEAPDGMEFAHWYQVDRQLQGDAAFPYDFKRPITGVTYLMAHYILPEQEDADLVPGSEEDAGVESVAVSLYAALVVEGAPVEDGQFAAQLVGEGFSDMQVYNVGDRFLFPEIVFTKQQLGDHAFYVQAVVDAPQPGFIYDQAVYTIRVHVAEDEDGLITASVIRPDAAHPVTITHIYSNDVPVVRLYVNVRAGQELNLGDAVRFTAEAVNCGKNPQYQWQFSEDNQNWVDVTGATSSRLNITLTAGNARGYWRVGVTITD